MRTILTLVGVEKDRQVGYSQAVGRRGVTGLRDESRASRLHSNPARSRKLQHLESQSVTCAQLARMFPERPTGAPKCGCMTYLVGGPAALGFGMMAGSTIR